MNVERNIARIDSSSNSQRLEHISHQSSIGPLPAAYAGISALAGVLALITASECGSVLHLGSMLYGAVLWGWWAIVACALWRAGERRSGQEVVAALRESRYDVLFLDIQMPGCDGFEVIE